ncbi:hypothetical protein MMC11_005074 [Xylographa trunciseda]|nr:hypothetical protein [Xylographa trunciseda]
MAPISTKKEQERSLLYTSHGISASRFNTDEIRKNPTLTLETLKRKQENEKKKENAPAVQLENTGQIKSSSPAKSSRISGRSKLDSEAARSGSLDTASADLVYGPALKNDVVMLPDNFEILGTSKPRCSDPLDELCKALRVPHTVLEVPSGSRQAQGPTTNRLYRRDELGGQLHPSLQNFGKATSEEYGSDYEVTIEKVGPDNRSQAERIWDDYFFVLLPLAIIAGILSIICLGACCKACCGACCGGSTRQRVQRSKAETEIRRRLKKEMKADAKQMKADAKADAEQAKKEARRTGQVEADIEMMNVNQV